MLENTLSSGFYFSHKLDLTARRETGISDDRYWWNKNLYGCMEHTSIDPCWRIKMIQGYADFSETYVNSKPLRQYLISRRQTGKAGMRFKMRGANDKGEVANFVETDQILQYGAFETAVTSIRGSVPCYWS